MTTLNIETFKAYEQVLTYGKPFYASDFDLSGGTISAMETYGLIQPTGNTKIGFAPVGGELYKKVEIKEWECVILASKNKGWGNRKLYVDHIVEEYREFIEMFDHICEIELAMLRD